MQSKSIFIFCFVLNSCVLFGQNSEKFKNLDWRIFHSLNFSDHIDIESDEWKNMPRKEKIALLQIPENELKTMSTKELIDAYTDCAFTRNLFLLSEVKMYYEQLYRGFNGVRELLSREGVVEETINYYADMDPQRNTVSPAGMPILFQIQFIEYLIGNPNMLVKMNSEQIRRIATELIKKYYIIQNVGFEDNLQSNIYAIVQVLGCTTTGKQKELVKIKDIYFLQKTGRIPNDGITSQVIDLANDFVGK